MTLIGLETYHLIHNQHPFTLNIEPCVMALGFFDGVHLGHQRVIHTAKEIANEKNVKLAVMTFYPHPKEVLSNGNRKVYYLTPMAVKEDIFARLGVDRFYVVKFDPLFAELSPQDFIHQYVIGLGAVHVVAGFDFTYGCKGQGTMATIGEDGKGKFQVTTVPKVQCNEEKISSTFIRKLISQGDVQRIPSFLGDFYETRGKFQLNSRGHDSGNHTLIVTMHPFFMIPAIGFYEIEAMIDQQNYRGIGKIREGKRGSFHTEIKLFNRMENPVNPFVKIKWMKQISKKDWITHPLLYSNNFENVYTLKS